MSFSNDVKNELSRLETNEVCCDKAELLGVLRMSGAIVIRGMNIGIHFSTENAALARRVLQILKNNYQVQTEVVITRSRRLKKNNRYQVRVLPAPQVNIAMTELQLLSIESDLKNPLLTKQCCKRAFLRGAFLGGGSISRPSSDYHLEMVTGNEDFARSIIKVMHTFSMKAKLTDRKNDYIVYLKDGESITNFLRVIGAHNSMMELENARVLKEMRNMMKPDVIVHFPGKRDIIIDSKVSLKAYMAYLAAEDDAMRAFHIKEHVASVRRHIDQLASKRYDKYHINSLDYVMLFIPNEPSYFMAMEADNKLWNYAYKKNIVLISPSNLISTLFVVNSLWTRERQQRDVQKIVDTANAIYDKFVNFTDNFTKIDVALKKADEAYTEAFKQLTSGKGNITKRLNELKEQGLLTTTKQIPDGFLDGE